MIENFSKVYWQEQFSAYPCSALQCYMRKRRVAGQEGAVRQREITRAGPAASLAAAPMLPLPPRLVDLLAVILPIPRSPALQPEILVSRTLIHPPRLRLTIAATRLYNSERHRVPRMSSR